MNRAYEPMLTDVADTIRGIDPDDMLNHKVMVFSDKNHLVSGRTADAVMVADYGGNILGTFSNFSDAAKVNDFQVEIVRDGKKVKLDLEDTLDVDMLE